MSDGGIILGDAMYPVPGAPAGVRTWLSTNLKFDPSGPGARPRAQTIDLFVLHWTGGEGGARQVFNTLSRKNYGVEFCIDQDGAIWQFADPLRVDTFDAGKYNRRSMGVEIVNYGFTGPNRVAPGQWVKWRGTHRTTLRKRERFFARFLVPQLRAALALVDAVIESGTTDIERRLPRYFDHPGQVISETLPDDYLSNYGGVLGHFHLTDRKDDPGMEIFDWFDVAGYD